MAVIVELMILVAILDTILDNNVVPLLSQLQHAFS